MKKAFFLTSEDLKKLILSIQQTIEQANSRYPYDGYARKASAEELADGIVNELEKIHSPINIDNVNVTELSEPCRFFPGKDIIGFTTSPGILKGVFIKENK